MKRSTLALILAGGCLHPIADAAVPAVTPDDVSECKLLRSQQWQPTGTMTLSACADEIAQRADVHEASGVRFGFWGQTLLAARTGGVFRSDNGGNSWKPALATAPSVPAVSSRAAGIPALAGTAAPRAAPVRSADPAPPATAVELAAASASAAPPQEPTPKAAEPAAAPPSPDPVATPPPNPTPAPPPRVAAAPVDTTPRASCQLKRGDDWTTIPRSTMAHCVSSLDSLHAGYDASGLLRAYWGGSYLIADRETIYRSDDGRHWTPLQARAGVRP